MRMRPANLGWLAAYIAFLALLTSGAFYLRTVVVAHFATPEAQADWNAWREAAARPGPVARRPPQSEAPPVLVLMRDHFAVCLGMAWLLGSGLWFTLVFLVRGIFSARRGPAGMKVPDFS